MDAIQEVEGVSGVHHVHAWGLTSGRNIFSAHVQVRDAREGERVLERVHHLLKDRFGFYFSTVQVE